VPACLHAALALKAGVVFLWQQLQQRDALGLACCQHYSDGVWALLLLLLLLHGFPVYRCFAGPYANKVRGQQRVTGVYTATPLFEQYAAGRSTIVLGCDVIDSCCCCCCCQVWGPAPADGSFETITPQEFDEAKQQAQVG